MKLIGVVVALCIAGIALAGCSSTPATARQKMQSWNTQVGLGPIDSQLDHDLGYLKDASKAHDFIGLQTNCDGFPGDVEALYETLPAPLTLLTNEMNNATQSWFSAAHACLDAKSFSSAAYRTYVKELNAGNGSYTAAKKLLATYGIGKVRG